MLALSRPLHEKVCGAIDGGLGEEAHEANALAAQDPQDGRVDILSQMRRLRTVSPWMLDRAQFIALGVGDILDSLLEFEVDVVSGVVKLANKTLHLL